MEFDYCSIGLVIGEEVVTVGIFVSKVDDYGSKPAVFPCDEKSRKEYS